MTVSYPLLSVNRGSRIVGLVTGAHFLSHFYILTLPPLFPRIRTEFALSNAELGVLVSLIAVGPLLFQIPLGNLVDRIGGTSVLIAGLALTAGGIGLAGIARSYWALLLCAGLSGLGQAVFHPADYAIFRTVREYIEEQRCFSIHLFGGYLGFVGAPVVVGMGASIGGWRFALLATGTVGVAYAFVLTRTLETSDPVEAPDESDETDDPNDQLRSQFLRPAVLLVFVFFFLLTMGTKGIQTFTTVLFVEQFGMTERIGNTVLTAFFVCTTIGILLGGTIARRFVTKAVVTVPLLIAGGALVMLSAGYISKTAFVPHATFALAGLCVGVTLPARDALVNLIAGDAVGRTFGIAFTGLSLAGVVAPAAFGATIDAFGVVLTFALIGGSYVLAVVAIALATTTSDANGG